MSLYKDASLAMIPTAYKDGKLYSVRPTDGSGDFTFSRGSNLSATRVDASQLIEKGRENLLLYSNDFSNAAWSTSPITLTSGQSGYDGSNDAWEAEVAVNGNYQSVIQATNTSGLITNSIYAKAGNSNYLGITDSGGSGGSNCIFDLTDGSISYQNGGDFIETSSESIGNGWYRLKVTHQGTSPNYMLWFVANASNSTGGTAGDSVFIQDSQQENSLVATPYIESGATTGKAGILENTPRLDYSGGATCPSLLLEPSRTNLLVQSEYFEASYWIKSGGSLTSGFVSPDGTSNAYKFVEDTSTGTHILNKNIGAADGNSYTSSVFAKKGERGYLTLYSGGVFTDSCTFNLENGTSINNGTSTSKIELISNGWYKCSVTSINKSRDVYAMVNNGSSGTSGVVYTGDGTSGVYIYGAQLEQGSYPTSYIPTYGSAVTRSVDAMYKTGASALINSSQGTIFIETKFNSGSTTYTERIVKIDDGGSGSNQIGFSRYSTDSLNFYLVSGGVTQSNIIIALKGESYTNMKLAVSYAHNRIKVFRDGVEIGSDLSADMAVGLSRILFGNDTSGNLLSDQDMKQLLFFPTALTDSECIALTTI